MDYDFVLAALMRKRNFIASSLAIQKRLDAKLQMKRDADASAQAAPPGDPPASAAAPPGDPSGSAEDPAATSDKDDDVPDVEALLTGSVLPGSDAEDDVPLSRAAAKPSALMEPIQDPSADAANPSPQAPSAEAEAPQAPSESLFAKGSRLLKEDKEVMEALKLHSAKHNCPFPPMRYTLVIADVNYGLNKRGSQGDSAEHVWTYDDFVNFYLNVRHATTAQDFVCVVFCHDNQSHVRCSFASI